MKLSHISDKTFLELALGQARSSLAQGGFPAGAVLVKNGAVIGEGISVGHTIYDPTAHGDMVALRKACFELKTSDLKGAVLYTSLEPCIMCFGGAMWSSITRIVFACGHARVFAAYYGGHLYADSLNPNLDFPIDLVHLHEYEEQSLALVHTWEKSVAGSAPASSKV